MMIEVYLIANGLFIVILMQMLLVFSWKRQHKM